MISTRSLLCYFLAWSLCVLPIQAWFWSRHERIHALKHPRRGSGTLQSSVDWKGKESKVASSLGWNASTSRAASNDYKFSLPQPTILKPTLTSQGMTVTSIVPKYEVCDFSGGKTTSCSTVLETITTSACSAVVTGFFTRVTISDCDQSITFSTKNSYSLTTTSFSPSSSPEVPGRQAPSSTTYVQSVVSYFIAPWQSLEANDPSGITVLICTTDFLGHETCLQVQEVWVIHTEYVPVISTSSLSISRSFTSPVVLLIGPSQSLTVSAGNFDFSTEINYSTMSGNVTTTTSTIGTPSSIVTPTNKITSTTTTTHTVYLTTGITITRTISKVSGTEPITSLISSEVSVVEPTTTLNSTTTLTRTTTVRLQHY